MSRRLRLAGARTFRSLRVRNYRLFFTGQLVSAIGSWMQTVAQGWLVLDLTGSGVALGVTVALQFLPVMALGMWGGVIADHFDKRRVLLVTQVGSAVLALTLWGLVASGTVTLAAVYALVFLSGCVHLVDMPARQAFVNEMVGRPEVPNAIALNSAIFNAGRLVGPAVAGIVIASVGVAPAFLLNSVSYVATIVALRAMRVDELFRVPAPARHPGPVRAALRYVWSTEELRTPLLLMAAVGTFGMNFVVVLPLVARYELDGGASLYGTLTSLMALGSLAGALVMAGRSQPTSRTLVGAAGAFGASSVLAALAPSAATMAPVLLAAGVASIVYLATTNATLQLTADPALKGRVMALYGLVFLGSTPVGGPLMGWISEELGARVALASGGAATLAAAASVAILTARRRSLTTTSGDPHSAGLTAAA